MKYLKTFENKKNLAVFLRDYGLRDKIEKVKELIESGSDVNKKDINGISALEYTIIHKDDIKLCKLLIIAGADMNINTIDGNPILIYTAIHNIEIFKLLLKYGADVNIQNYFNRTALIYMSGNYIYNLTIIKLLIDAGADWNIKDDNGMDFLDYLKIEQKEKIIKLYPEKYKEYLIRKNVEKYNL